MKRDPVQSSNIKSVGYDPASATLEIEFTNGGVYQYSGVNQKTVDAMLSAESVGTFFRHNIKNGGYTWKKV